MTMFQRTLRAINRLGSGARAIGLPVGRLNIDALERAAVKQVGSDDFGDGYYREGLVALIEAAETDARIELVARVHLRSLLTLQLITRLRLEHARRESPRLERGPALAPLIVCGLPRSGTTFLHRLLAERSDARSLPLWELMEPLVGPGPDRRLDDARKRLGLLSKLTEGALDAQHLIRAELPDECGHLLKCTFHSSLYWQLPLYDYFDWYLQADVGPAYRDYRALLTSLASPERRLVLKDPFHARHLSSLFDVLPQACIVMTHRDPVEVVPSFHKLILSVQRLFSAQLDVERSVQSNTRWLLDLAERERRARATIAPERIFDVDYRELVAEPVRVVERIHEHFGLPFERSLRERLEHYVTQHPQHAHGANPYRAEDYGQRPEQIAEMFSDYRERHIP